MSGLPSARALALHEARVHAGPRRELRELEHGTLLHDPLDAEPFWNRLVAPSFPMSGRAFDARLTETLDLFGTLARYPHIRPMAEGNRPNDIADRLRRAGFVDVGEDRVMVLRDPGAAARSVPAGLPAGITVEHVSARTASRERTSGEIASVLAEAFGVGADREAAIARDARATIGQRGIEFVLVRIDDVVAAVAKRTSIRGVAYLSSVGTRPAQRGRGMGRLVTAAAVAGSVASGDRLVHLVVESGNGKAIAMYAALGFELVGGPVPDLLLRP